MAFAYLSVYGTARLLWMDRQQALRHPLELLHSAAQLTHMAVTLLPEYLDYYRADFHPAQRARTALLNHWRTRLAEQPEVFMPLRPAA